MNIKSLQEEHQKKYEEAWKEFEDALLELAELDIRHNKDLARNILHAVSNLRKNDLDFAQSCLNDLMSSLSDKIG